MHEYLDEDDYTIMILLDLLLNLNEIHVDLINELFVYLLLYLNKHVGYLSFRFEYFLNGFAIQLAPVRATLDQSRTQRAVSDGVLKFSIAWIIIFGW